MQAVRQAKAEIFARESGRLTGESRVNRTPKRISAAAVPYNTNLAAEFFVLSMLHRLGADPLLTLVNKQAVDIVITNPTAKP